MPRLGIDAHTATGLLGEAEHLGQAQARTLADVLGGEERLEHLGQHLFAHAAAGVANAQHHVFAGLRVFRALRAGADACVAGRQGQLAAFGHGVAGVDRQVEDDHLGLGRVGQRLPQAWVQVQAHRDVAAQGAA